METVLLLFLLMNFGKDGDAKKSLEKFLQFYRENRELIAMLAGGMNSPLGAQTQTQTPPPPREEPKEEHEKSRSEDRSGNLDLIEEFLKTRAV